MSTTVYIDWFLVVLKFKTAYEKVYCASKKAHFDCLPLAYKVVDGARTKWCNLMLLDAMIYFCNSRDFNFLSRRAFNQQKELFDAIIGSIKTERRDGVDKPDYTVEVVPSPSFPWDTLNSLKFCLVQSPPCKSKNKYLTSVDLLCSHPTLTSATMTEIIQKVVLAALNAVTQYHQQHRLQASRPVSKLPVERLASFEYLPRAPVCVKRSWSEDTYTDSSPPNKKQATADTGYFPQIFEGVFQDLKSAVTTTGARSLPYASDYISTNSSSSGNSSTSGSSAPTFWQSSVVSDATTSSLSDCSHHLLGSLSFDSMDSIDSLNEAINLLTGY